MSESYTDEKRRELLSYANRIATYITNEGILSDPLKAAPFLNELLNSESQKTSNRIIVVNGTGRIINDSNLPDAGWWTENPRVLLSADVLRALSGQSFWSGQSNGELMNVAVSIGERGQNTAEPAGAVLIMASVRDRNTLLDSMRQKLVLLTVLLSTIILILVFFISQLIIEPLKNILTAVKRITAGHLNQRVTFFGKDEFADLGEAFNDMTSRLEKVEEARSEFVSNVSHELKTPLSSVKVLSESLLLQDDADIAVYKEFLSDINSEVDRMTKIINDLLALVLLDRTEQSLTKTQIKLNNMLEDIIKRLRPLADQKKVTLFFKDPDLVTIEGDEMKMDLALSNVIENAIKYTNSEGGVTVELLSEGQQAIVSVRDTGIGINEAEVNKIFDRFYRVDKTRGRETGGTGLGLSITNKTILLHNGSIRVSSAENEGTTFTIKLPLESKTREI